MSAGNDSREDTARESGSESDTDSRSGDEPTQSPRPRVRYTGGAPRFASETGGDLQGRGARSAQPREHGTGRAEGSRRRRGGCRGTSRRSGGRRNADRADRPGGSPTLHLPFRGKCNLKITTNAPPTTRAHPQTPDPPSQAPSPSAAERTHEVRERLIRAVTNILNPLVNPPPLQEQCVVTLHTMVKNVADHPTDPKYRRVKASSRSITQKVVACRGGEEFLTAAGWRKVAIDYEAYLTCENTVPMDTLR